MALRAATIVVAILVLLSSGATADTLSGRVVRVADGDTLVLLVSGNRENRIRLSGIDCPAEVSGGACGVQRPEQLGFGGLYPPTAL